MCDEWMPALRFPLTPEQFRQLPRNPAYRYDHVEGEVRIRPAARCYHALLDLRAHGGRAAPLPAGLRVRPAHLMDFADLQPVFAASFAHAQPFAGVDEATRLTAARTCLGRTRDGGDGPWIEAGSFVVERNLDDVPVGGLFTTLLPATDPNDPDSYYWSEVPPDDCVARCQGRPHLTWIFVLPAEAGHGTGTALLATCVAALLRLGFHDLVTTFLLGNESSMLWHWRNGFRLLAYPWSKRRARQRT